MPIPDLLSATGALVLVVGLIFLLRYGARFVRPRASGGSGARLSLSSQLGIDNKRRLQLVQCDGSQVLILTGGASDVMMAWPPASGAQAAVPAVVPAWGHS